MTPFEAGEPEASRSGSLVSAAGETILLAASVPLLGRWLNHSDPFFVLGPVSWALLAPMLAGLRHGFLGGFGCAAVLSMALYECWRHPLLPVAAFPGPLIVALLIVGMVAGEFAQIWRMAARSIGAMRSYERRRFEEFARNYQLLKVSHDALEERAAGASGNLRNALATVRAELSRAVEGGSALAARGSAILDVFQAFAQVQTAALLPVDGDDVYRAVAMLGKVPESAPEDPLVVQAVRTKKVVSLAGERGAFAGDEPTELVAAVPLVDIGGRVWAVVAVGQMPFFALTAESLRLLALMGGAIADALTFGVTSAAAEPTMVHFRRQVERCARDARTHGVPATLLVLSVADRAAANQVVPRILEQRRGLDQARLVDADDGEQRLFILLPLTHPQDVDGYLARVDRALPEQLGGSLEAAGVHRVHVADLSLGKANVAIDELRRLGKLSDERAFA
jgi:polysaccharide biosynthesis protein PelD